MLGRTATTVRRTQGRLPAQALQQRHGHAYPPIVAGITRTRNFQEMDYNEFSPFRKWAVETIYSLGIDKWYINQMQHRRYGFHFEDIIAETPDVQKALERLPAEVLSDRDDRCKEALVLNGAGDILPKERWVTEEDDKPYMAPYLIQVITERRDREIFRPR